MVPRSRSTLPTARKLSAGGLLLLRRALTDGAVEVHKVEEPNSRRRYVLSVQPTLFGELAFERRWGRMSTTPSRPRGQVRHYAGITELLDDRSRDGLLAQAGRRARRGYRLN